MQTFLPYPDFQKSAAALDRARLGKQRVEAWQILNVLLKLKEDPTAKISWQNHPAVLMWSTFEMALCEYGIAVCTEWIERGYKDSLRPRFMEAMATLSAKGDKLSYPSWMYRPSFYTSHRSNLLRKDKKFYRKRWPKLSHKLPYVWPVRKNV